MHCWVLLRDSDKWSSHVRSRQEKTETKGKKRKDQAADDDEQPCEGENEGSSGRGPGIKKAKANNKKESRLEEMIASLIKSQNESTANEDRLIKAMEEKAEASKEKAKAIEESNELEMLKTDPETITNPVARQIFDLKLKTILERLQQKGSS
jgi:hypothetical protein